MHRILFGKMHATACCVFSPSFELQCNEPRIYAGYSTCVVAYKGLVMWGVRLDNGKCFAGSVQGERRAQGFFCARDRLCPRSFDLRTSEGRLLVVVGPC
jgi:hypothetical protein